MDFMGGKSSLLATMGPTGSGKTYTMFGSQREPGMVPLALQKIFCHVASSGELNPSRSYYLSMFEVYSERGKGERIFDLLPDGGVDVFLQQSTIKGLQEVLITNVIEADSIIARGMLKRATAATDANSQSSRSQCIINIRCVVDNNEYGNDVPPNSPVFTIVDLAGAERERKTGNQGARLLESSFINNTSMVFSLCLRSLLEHQKNPKKSFQKHFNSSLLTRYLKDYMEGKKRMTLILTVKPGEDDYLDTSFLLRQASPYMKIKFSSNEEFPGAPCRKRITASIGLKPLKRRKTLVDCNKCDTGTENETKTSDRENISEKLQESEPPKSLDGSLDDPKAINKFREANKELKVELRRMKRNDEIMQNFSRALWNVLKQYKQKLEESENEVQSLKEAIKKKSTQILKLEELEELRNCNSCHKQTSREPSCSEVDACSLGPSVLSADQNNSENSNSAIDETPAESENEVQSLKEAIKKKSTQIMKLEELEELRICNSCHKQSLREPSCSEVEACSLGPSVPSAVENNSENSNSAIDETPTIVQYSPQTSLVTEDDTKVEDSVSQGISYDTSLTDDTESTLDSSAKTSILPVEEKKNCNGILLEDHVNGELNEVNGFEVKEKFVVEDMSSASVLRDSIHPDPLLNHSHSSVISDVKSSSNDHGTLPENKQAESHVSFVENVRESEKSQAKNPLKEAPHSVPKPLNADKPKRRLLPVSAMLLKEFNGLNMELENAKEGRGKATAERRGRSQGSMALIRVLKDNQLL